MSLNPLDYVYDWSAIASFFVASAALISSVIAYKAIKLQEATIELQKSNFDLQRQKVEEEFTVAWTNQVINWANKCCDVISCLESKAKYEVNSDKDAIANLLGSLSSLIDRGRLLFENERSDGYGQGKPRAFQGYRPYMLDCLVDIYDNFQPAASLKGAEPVVSYLVNQEVSKVVTKYKREFVSQVQEVVDPEWFHRRATKFEKRKDT